MAPISRKEIIVENGDGESTEDTVVVLDELGDCLEINEQSTILNCDQIVVDFVCSQDKIIPAEEKLNISTSRAFFTESPDSEDEKKTCVTGLESNKGLARTCLDNSFESKSSEEIYEATRNKKNAELLGAVREKLESLEQKCKDGDSYSPKSFTYQEDDFYVEEQRSPTEEYRHPSDQQPPQGRLEQSFTEMSDMEKRLKREEEYTTELLHDVALELQYLKKRDVNYEYPSEEWQDSCLQASLIRSCLHTSLNEDSYKRSYEDFRHGKNTALLEAVKTRLESIDSKPDHAFSKSYEYPDEGAFSPVDQERLVDLEAMLTSRLSSHGRNLDYEGLIIAGRSSLHTSFESSSEAKDYEIALKEKSILDEAVLKLEEIDENGDVMEYKQKYFYYPSSSEQSDSSMNIDHTSDSDDLPGSFQYKPQLEHGSSPVEGADGESAEEIHCRCLKNHSHSSSKEEFSSQDASVTLSINWNKEDESARAGRRALCLRKSTEAIRKFIT